MLASTSAPLVIEAAINGMTTPARNPSVPQSAEEIAAESVACIEAGASVIHTHLPDLRLSVEETINGYLAAWQPVLEARPDALLYATFRDVPDAAGRSAHIWALAQAGVTTLSYVDTGSVSVGEAGADGLPAGTSVYVNTYDDCRYMFDRCHRFGLGASIAVFEPGFLRVVLAYAWAGRLPAGSMVKFYFGGDRSLFTGRPTPITFGLPPTPPSLDAYLAMLGDTAIPWAVAVLGGDVTRSAIGQEAVVRGGHLRLGLEDFAGDRTPTNVELILEAVELGRRLGRHVATPAQAADLLALKPLGRAAGGER